MQPPPHAVGVAALVEQTQHVPQIRADQVQQRPTAHLVVHPPQPAGDVVEVIDHPGRQRQAAAARRLGVGARDQPLMRRRARRAT